MKPKSLSELRDESSRFGFEAGDAWPRTAREKKHFVDGWTACQDELLKRAEVLVNALEVYAMTNETFPEYGDVAREALTKYKALTGEG